MLKLSWQIFHALGSGVKTVNRPYYLILGYYERNGTMQKIVVAVLLTMLLICACETTPSKEESREEKAGGPVEVTIGGDVRVQGEYRDSD
jgi:hypothetical protein